MVKQVKHIIVAGLGNRIVPLSEFQFIVAEAECLVNKRPIALKSLLSANDKDPDLPCAITPELLIRGYEVPSMNILPVESGDSLDDMDWLPNSSKVFEDFASLNKTRSKIHSLYEKEFLRTLEIQATNTPRRYSKHSQTDVNIGDLVAIRTNLVKPYHYPIGIVQELKYNDLQEINEILIKKANNELLRRHPSDVILLMHGNAIENEPPIMVPGSKEQIGVMRPSRQAKTKCNQNMRDILSSGLA